MNVPRTLRELAEQDPEAALRLLGPQSLQGWLAQHLRLNPGRSYADLRADVYAESARRLMAPSSWRGRANVNRIASHLTPTYGAVMARGDLLDTNVPERTHR